MHYWGYNRKDYAWTFYDKSIIDKLIPYFNDTYYKNIIEKLVVKNEKDY